MKQKIKNLSGILFKIIMIYFIIAGIIFTLNLPAKEKKIPDKTAKQIEEFISGIKVNIDYEPEMGYKYLTSFKNSMLENIDIKKIADVSSESGNLYEKSVIYNYLYKILEKYSWNQNLSEDFHLDMSKIWVLQIVQQIRIFIRNLHLLQIIIQIQKLILKIFLIKIKI